MFTYSPFAASPSLPIRYDNQYEYNLFPALTTGIWIPIFLDEDGLTSLSSKGYNLNDPELEQLGHSVVEPSGCIKMMDESGIQFQNLFRKKQMNDYLLNLLDSHLFIRKDMN
jgi:hypothetical protein